MLIESIMSDIAYPIISMQQKKQYMLLYSVSFAEFCSPIFVCLSVTYVRYILPA